jgi:nicotinate-nucleotide pyrophosphorylase (carboxylating)
MNKTEYLISSALSEDIPSGDITTDSLDLGKRPGKARLIAKSDLVLSGSSLFEEAVLTMDPGAKLKWAFRDSDFVFKGQILGLIQADLPRLLKAERVGLNLMGHLSGIATLTRRFVKEVEHTKTKILDTRKTLPLYRLLEKKAVRDGGGQNHRMNLSDAILIKENHICAIGSITEAVGAIRKRVKLPIEVEVRNLEEVEEAVGLAVQRILLDNMTNAELVICLKIIPRSIEVEASGNMTLERVKSVAETGVHFISVGALTHSAPCADISLMFDWTKEE